MPVTPISVFNASTSNPDDRANAKPIVAFTYGKITLDAAGGKLMMVRFRPCVQALTDFRDVAFHVHIHPYQGQSGMNLRAADANTGIVGAGVGRLAHGDSVDRYSDLFPFYKKLKDAAKDYILDQIKAEREAGKVSFQIPFKVNTPEKLNDHIWALRQFWERPGNFQTATRAYSPEARSQLANNGPYAGSILAVGNELDIEAHTDANGGGPQPIGAAAAAGVPF